MRAFLLFFMVMALSSVSLPAKESLNPFVEVRRTEGTGLTTGHVATLTLKNLGFAATRVVPATFYIPSDLVYQSYVARIEEPVIIPGDAIVEIKLYGYCADVSKPPAREGKQMIDFKQWILIVPPSQAEDALVLRPDRQIRPWDKGITPDSVRFTLTPPAVTATAVATINWPGTSTPVRGLIDPDQEPYETASLIVACLETLEAAGRSLQTEGRLITPFRDDPKKAYSTVIQHAFWVTMARLTGITYDKKVFAANAARRIQPDNEAQQTEFMEGVNTFWQAFLDVGEASQLY